MIQPMLRAITAQYHLNAITLGEFTKMKLGGTEIQIWAFRADGLGHVSAVTVSGFLGLKKTDTLIINPTQKDMPLFSCRRDRAKGSDTLTCEMFHTLLEQPDLKWLEEVKGRYARLPDQAPEANCFDSIKLPSSFAKKGKKGQSAELDACAMDCLEVFLEAAAQAPYCDPDAKKEKASVYVEGLLSNGGPSADLFRKSMDEEKAGELFRRFLFGTLR